MPRPSEAPQTILFLEQHQGADWQDIATQFNLSRIGVCARIRAARAYLIDNGSNKTIPRPTRNTGWKYEVTHEMYAPPQRTSIARSSNDDLQAMSGTCRRLSNDFQVAWDEMPSAERRSKAGRNVSTAIHALDSMQDVLRTNRKTLAAVLNKVPATP